MVEEEKQAEEVEKGGQIRGKKIGRQDSQGNQSTLGQKEEEFKTSYTAGEGQRKGKTEKLELVKTEIFVEKCSRGKGAGN